jgi:hypothetical protein
VPAATAATSCLGAVESAEERQHVHAAEQAAERPVQQRAQPVQVAAERSTEVISSTSRA